MQRQVVILVNKQNCGGLYSLVLGTIVSKDHTASIFTVQATTSFNPLKPNGYYMYRLLLHTKTLHSAHTMCLYVPYGSHNK
jgi:hypothetical protein